MKKPNRILVVHLYLSEKDNPTTKMFAKNNPYETYTHIDDTTFYMYYIVA